MKEWKDVLVELAKKLTPPFAFAILLLVVLAYWGAQISDDYIQLVYAVSLGIPLLWAIVTIAEIVRNSKAIGGDKNEQRSQAEIGGDLSGTVVQGNRNIIQNIVNNYAPKADKPQKEELEAQLVAYLNWVQESFGSITLRGIEQEGRQVVTLPLETVYVPLQAEASPDDEDQFVETDNPEKMRQRMEEKRGTEKIKLNQVLGVGKRVIVTGGPGSGKTTVLQHIAWTLACAIQSGKPSLAKEKLGLDSLPLPIYVPLSLYAAYRRDLPKNAGGKQKSLATFISDYLLQRQMHLDLSADFLAALLREGRDVILLLDGLDEVPNEDERAHTRQSIEDLVAGRENLRVLVTSRVAAYRGNTVLGRGFRNIRVLPLNPENVTELVTQAYRSIYKTSDIQARDKARDLLTDIQRLESERRERLGEGTEAFVDSPLMVRMLLIVHFNNRRLPDQRADLYQKAVDAMLRPDYNLDQDVSDEIEHRVAGSLAMNREMLQYLAYHMHGQGKGQGREIEEAALRGVLESEPTYAPFVDELIGQTRQRGTLLEERGGLYRFIHLSFQEFLAGRYFVEVVRDIETIAAQVEAGLAADSWWREPILLTVGYLDLTAPGMARRLLLRLSGADDGCAVRDKKMELDECLSVAELAASAYLECKSQQPDLGEKLKTRLLGLHRRGQDAPCTPMRMAAVADLIDTLGYSPPDL
ncbi:MAG: NACHT domain-containing protein, partial [Anaerolineales bacterium]|nr:NACHT domain-containing protein [Anaerolineales bacterium]